MKSISDFVANEMAAVLNSAEHKAKFSKYAQDVNSAKVVCCEKCSKESCDCSMADDNDARKAKKEESTEESSDSSSSTSSTDSSKADDSNDHFGTGAPQTEESKTSSAYNVAIDGLLTASAALDSLGLDTGSALTLKIASFVVDAKKKEVDAKKEKEKAKALKAKEKEKKDALMAKEKAAKEKAKAKEKADKEKEKEKAAKEKAKASASKSTSSK